MTIITEGKFPKEINNWHKFSDALKLNDLQTFLFCADTDLQNIIFDTLWRKFSEAQSATFLKIDNNSVCNFLLWAKQIPINIDFKW